MTSILSSALSTLQCLSSSLLKSTTRPKRVTLLITGLDNTGKTTLLHRMRNLNPGYDPVSGSAFSSASWTDIQLTTTTGKHLLLDAIDLGGLRYRDHPGGIRQLWRDSLTDVGVDGIVFVVDAADRERFGKAEALLGDLWGVLREFEREGPRGEADSTREGRRAIPVLVLGNKIDAVGAVSEEELRDVMGVPVWGGNKSGGRDGKEEVEVPRPVELFMCTVVTNQGYQEGFEWLVRHV